MVKRKYLANALTAFCACFLFITTSKIASAEAWIPGDGKSQYYFSAAFADKKSEKSLKNRAELFVEAQNAIKQAYIYRDQIFAKASNANRELTAFEKEEIREIDEEIELFKQHANEINSFKDKMRFKFFAETSLSKKTSAGLVIDYVSNRFPSYSSPYHKESITGADFNLFYKVQILQYQSTPDKSFCVTIRPSIAISFYDKKSFLNYIDAAIFFGQTNKYKYFDAIHEIGLGVRQYNTFKKGRGVGHFGSILDGIKFPSGFMISNFLQYEQAGLKNRAYNKTIYEQISLAMEFTLNKRPVQTVNAQIGYFWKNSLLDKDFFVSGPILSFWLNL